MNPLLVDETAGTRLQDIAADYKAQGYDVLLEPRAGKLPDFLAGFEPDLIAVGQGESIVVKVKSRSELVGAPFTSDLEDALRGRTGWRFELIIDGTVSDRETLNAAQIRALLEECLVLERQKHWAAALMVLWSATEGALRLLAKREHVVLESLSAEYLLTRLYTLGLLGRAQYRTLDRAMRKRSQAAHGYQVAITSEDVGESAAVLKELLSEVEMKAA
jgi:hypothetical protein